MEINIWSLAAQNHQHQKHVHNIFAFSKISISNSNSASASMETCFAKTPSGPLVTPSLHELGIGEGLDSMEGLLMNLEGFWLAVVLAVENLEGFGMPAEVVGANLEVGFAKGVSSIVFKISSNTSSKI